MVSPGVEVSLGLLPLPLQAWPLGSWCREPQSWVLCQGSAFTRTQPSGHHPARPVVLDESCAVGPGLSVFPAAWQATLPLAGTFSVCSGACCQFLVLAGSLLMNLPCHSLNHCGPGNPSRILGGFCTGQAAGGLSAVSVRWSCCDTPCRGSIDSASRALEARSPRLGCRGC